MYLVYKISIIIFPFVLTIQKHRTLLDVCNLLILFYFCFKTFLLLNFFFTLRLKRKKKNGEWKCTQTFSFKFSSLHCIACFSIYHFYHLFSFMSHMHIISLLFAHFFVYLCVCMYVANVSFYFSLYKVSIHSQLTHFNAVFYNLLLKFAYGS